MSQVDLLERVGAGISFRPLKAASAHGKPRLAPVSLKDCFFVIRPAYLGACWKVRSQKSTGCGVGFDFLTAAAASRSVLPDSFEGE